MKKGKILSLGTILLAVAANVGFANAPTFEGIPDVVIGDYEFNEANGLTADWNFFRYINAYNVLDFVADNDSTLTDLRFAFKEWPVEQDNDLEINDRLQLLMGSGEDSQDKSTWGGKELSGGGANFWFSFRDLIRSPQPNDPSVSGTPFPDPKRTDGTDVSPGDFTTQEFLPWHNARPGNLALPLWRSVQLYVADEDNSVSDTFFVFSVNNGMDDLSGGFTTIFSNSFDLWAYDTTDFGLTFATSSGGTTFLGLEDAGTGAAGGGIFGRWQMTPDPADTSRITQRIESIPGHEIYQGRFRLNGAVSSAGGPAHKTYLSGLRFGHLSGGGNIINDILLRGVRNDTADYDNQYPGIGGSKDYNVWWESQNGKTGTNWDGLVLGGIDGRTWTAYFDLFDMNVGTAPENEGLWTLEDYLVGRIARPPTVTAGPDRIELNDLRAATGFAIGGQGGTMSVTENADGSITIVDGGEPPTPSFLLWERLDVVEWQADKITRVRTMMSCPTTTDRDNFHNTRVRGNTYLGNIICVSAIGHTAVGNQGAPIAQDGDATAMTPYEFYWSSFGGPGPDLLALPQNFRMWLLAYDQVGGGTGAGVANPTNITIHSALIEILDEPAGI